MFSFGDIKASIDRAEWSPKKQAAWEAAQQALAEAERQVRLANRVLIGATQVLQAVMNRSIYVAKVTVQKREDYPGFNPLYDLPIEKQESTDRTGHVFTYDRTKYRELHRKENPNWKAQLAEVQQRIKDAQGPLDEAQAAYNAAQTALNKATRKVESFG